ncbi:LOW QUALITY PROTEIN: membrane cofactor protein-like [Cottoperca gobio]|uniref:LOW QUALITY PROTEIN: membrane cofactor protein-like n=1 Tax=Cottoperca gobio TaxID=56716 RepID=A0A6J2P7M7_COTGO|nr:LOW QUALITY PROTEIN: membrane cofactor protein-like [Cottoperca gobio]
MGVTYFLFLSLCLGVATQAQDCSRPVGGDNMGLKGNDILLDTFADQIKVTFTCDVGYTSAGGSPSITCTAGEWSPLRLTCERKNCGTVGEVANGHIEYPDGTQFGDKYVVICDTGYNRVGQASNICGSESVWYGRLPVCEVTTCDPPPAVVNGIFSPIKEVYDYREVIQYSCLNDITLHGSKTRSCSSDGTFEPAPPTCKIVLCEEPNIPGGNWYEGSRPPYRYMSTVTYRCKSGFTMKGEATIVCGIDDQWSPALPTCQQIIIPPKVTTTTATATTTTRTQRPTAAPSPSTHAAHTTAPSSPPGPPAPPGNDGNALAIGLGLGLTAVIALLALCGCHYFGLLESFKEKRRSRRGIPDTVVPKDGEELALS